MKINNNEIKVKQWFCIKKTNSTVCAGTYVYRMQECQVE